MPDIERYAATDVPAELEASLLELTLPDGDMAKVFRSCAKGGPYYTGQVLVARDADRVVGWALRWHADFHKSKWILHLFVHPDHRCRGVGTALVEAARFRLRSTTVLRGCVWDDTSAEFWAAVTSKVAGTRAPDLRRHVAA